jgi:hypothetical protein
MPHIVARSCDELSVRRRQSGGGDLSINQTCMDQAIAEALWLLPYITNAKHRRAWLKMIVVLRRKLKAWMVPAAIRALKLDNAS